MLYEKRKNREAWVSASTDLAKEIGVPEPGISAICRGKRSITADTAVRLAFFGTIAGFWLGLQADYDTCEVERSESETLTGIYRWDGDASHA